MSERFSGSKSVDSSRLPQDERSFEERIHEARKTATPPDVFGGLLIHTTQILGGAAGFAPPEYYRQHKRIVASLTETLTDLLRSKNKEGLRELVWLLDPFLAQSDALELVLRATGQRAHEVGEMSAEDRAQRALEGVIRQLASKRDEAFSDEGGERLLLAIVTAHAERIESEQRQIQAHVPKYIETVQRQMFELIKNGRVSLTPEYIQRRLEAARVIVCDPLTSYLDRFGGRYEPDTHDILLKAGTTEFARLRAYICEAVCALQGRSEVMREYKEDGHSRSTQEVVREGLAFYRPVPAEPRFAWLDVAVADRLAELLIAPTKTRSVGARFIEALARIGIPERMVFDAYFEQDVSEQESGPNPAIRALFARANEVLGPRMMVELDGLIRVAELHVDSSVVLDDVCDLLEQNPRALRNYVQQEKALFDVMDAGPVGDA